MIDNVYYVKYYKMYILALKIKIVDSEQNKKSIGFYNDVFWNTILYGNNDKKFIAESITRSKI